MLNGFVAMVLDESLTCTVKLLVPAAVGVPVITPAAEIANPSGSAPELILQV